MSKIKAIVRVKEPNEKIALKGVAKKLLEGASSALDMFGVATSPDITRFETVHGMGNVGDLISINEDFINVGKDIRKVTKTVRIVGGILDEYPEGLIQKTEWTFSDSPTRSKGKKLVVKEQKDV